VTALPRIHIALGVALAVGLSACTADAPNPASARQASFKRIAKANKAITEELKKPAPAVELLKTNAIILGELAPQVATWFPEGTGPQSGIETEAKPAIWQQKDAFRKAAGAFVTATQGLQAAAASGDIEQIKAAAPKVGGTCKGCHDTFRAKK
jgi:cytochrome c556